MFFFDDKILVVGGFNKVLLLNDQEMAFDFKRYTLAVEGDTLIMPYLEDKEVGIKGVIKNICVKYKMVKDNDK